MRVAVRDDTSFYSQRVESHDSNQNPRTVINGTKTPTDTKIVALMHPPREASMGKNKKTDNEATKRTLVVAQDMKLIKALAGNDKKLRDRALKNLRKWFDHRNTKMPFTNDDFMRIWKGLFYAMWMSDKPLIQEECAENISQLIHFTTPESSLTFFKCGLALIATEWFGIDQWRMDKFLMLVRRILRQGLDVLKRSEWNLESVEEFNNALLETVLKKDNSAHLGLTMHVIEIYLEELAKVSNGNIEESTLTELLRPFVKYLSTLADARQIAHVKKFMFHHLIRQSDEGIEYETKFEAWKERGFPDGTIESIQKVEADDGELSIEEGDEELHPQEKPLDPRAGHVDVELPQLKFDALEVSKLMHELKFGEGSTTKARKAITKLEHEFEKLSSGVYPFGFKKIRLPAHDGYSMKLRKSVNRLVKFEKKLLNDSNKNRSRKRKSVDAVPVKPKRAKFDSADFFQNKLQEFIEKSEGSLKKGSNKSNLKSNKTKKVLHSKPEKKKPSKLDFSDWAFEDHFRRNSGTWIVHRLDSPKSNGEVLDTSSQSVKIATPKSTTLRTKKQSPKSSIETPTDSPRLRRRSSTLFRENEWDIPPKEGEVEIFVPSNKFKKKMEVKAKEEGKDVSDVVNSSLKRLVKGHKLIKGRYSLDAKLVKNPFAKNGTTPRSEKKVKIDLRLNRSQDILEHQAQLLSSPAIPYDASKQPVKPLLKPNAIKSPINPFYKRKLKLL